MNKHEYSDQNRKGLFNGDGIDYIRMRADKHEKIYHLPEQAEHLRKLADELEVYKNKRKPQNPCAQCVGAIEEVGTRFCPICGRDLRR